MLMVTYVQVVLVSKVPQLGKTHQLRNTILPKHRSNTQHVHISTAQQNTISYTSRPSISFQFVPTTDLPNTVKHIQAYIIVHAMPLKRYAKALVQAKQQNPKVHQAFQYAKYPSDERLPSAVLGPEEKEKGKVEVKGKSTMQ
jgi:hypothetical protein